ncbi:hypothetical protein C2G38_2189220 [Gigaspora rosea]|uniref:HCP-like protein n=1 Tax=Gigaspora rosea TaxID=44941 RepID=A0A397V714_9GLOM|nr:hypothetical protein C2G38_2189220 [Gigaspora rosea]
MSTGQRPFDGRPFDLCLSLDIYKGLRPEIAPVTPECYIELAKKSHMYYQKSCKNGRYICTQCYRRGQEESIRMFYKSVEMEDVKGIREVRYSYKYGIEVKKIECKAFEYSKKKPAYMGNVIGTNEVGLCYENGIGVKQDKYKAFEYYKKCVDMGHKTGTYNERVVTSEYESNIEMCEGLRPTILEGITSYYMELLKNDEEILASFSKLDKEMIKYYACDFNDGSAYGSKFINLITKEAHCPDRIISKFKRLVTRNYTPVWFGDKSEVNIKNNISEKEKIQQCCIVNDADSPDETALG